MEKIVEIKDCKIVGKWGSMEGYEVVTDRQNITMTIDNGQCCCENWGYFWCNDNPQDFIGAELLSVTLTDDALNEAYMDVHDLNPKHKFFEGGVMFVNLNTNQGTLQFVAYNEHNGYYGHNARVECVQLTHEECL